MVVGEPADELGALGHLGRVQRRRVGGELGDHAQGTVTHLLPVLDRLAHVAQHPLQGLLDEGDVVLVDDPVDLHVHPRLAHRVRRRLLDHALLDRADGLEGAGDVAGDGELRVDDDVHVVLGRASSMVTESTRNGMSSVTTSTTEWPAADQPGRRGPG